MIKCKDYFIFKIRYFADRKVLARLGPNCKQHIERAGSSIEFFWNLVEKITNKKRDYFYSNYMFNAIDCALEEIEETYGVFRFLIDDGCYTYLIPIKNIETIEWVKLNLKSADKIVKKTSVGYIPENKDLKYKRREAKDATDLFKHRIFVEENTRKILIEKDENRPGKKRINKFIKLL